MPENVESESIITVTEDFPVPDYLIGLTEEQVNEVINQSLIQDLRNHRNNLLSETDWTQNADVPQSTRDRWTTYRQELRDITVSNQNLNGVVWPTKPE